jgi:hypothetical protein
MTIWTAALILSRYDFADPTTNANASDAAAALMWAGNFWYVWKLAFRTIMQLAYPGALPIERQHVCANTGFALHRNNEFMFLMLGETVLQIIVAVDPGEVARPGEDPFFNVSVGVAAAGFVIAASMMFSFRSMVRGQIENYDRTNAGLANQGREMEVRRHAEPAPQWHSRALHPSHRCAHQ